MSKLTKKQRIFVINNLIIFFISAIAVPVTLMIGSRAARLDNSPYPYWQHIVSFTLQSAIFLELVAGISTFIVLFSKKKNIPIPGKKTIQLWYLVASTASMITCLTVLFFLAPLRATKGLNYFDPLLETMFFLHFFNPVFSAITYILTAEKIKISLKTRLLAILPITLYAIPYIICVVILKIWPDFYGLTFGGKYYLLPIVYIIFAGLSFVIASVLIKLRDVLQK